MKSETHPINGLDGKIIEEIPLGASDPLLALMRGFTNVNVGHKMAASFQVLDVGNRGVEFVIDEIRLSPRTWNVILRREATCEISLCSDRGTRKWRY